MTALLKPSLFIKQPSCDGSDEYCLRAVILRRFGKGQKIFLKVCSRIRVTRLIGLCVIVAKLDKEIIPFL